MITGIVQFIVTAFSDLLELFIDLFLKALSISSLDEYISVFPILKTCYSYLRGFSVGMTAIIAGKSLAMFALGSIDNGNVKDRPTMILMKSFAAVGLIYWGGYILEYIIYLGSIPYDQFLKLNAASAVTADSATRLGIGILEYIALESSGIGLLADGASAFASLFLVCVIGWNLFKLVLEVCERWLMVGVLLYTSPLAYCTIPSSETSSIFQRWFSMFIGAVLQMSLSVLFLKIVLSGFAGTAHTLYVIKLLMILAMCKIAQRVDTYLQQIGVGAPTTGGGMLDDLVAGARAAGNFLGKKNGGGEGGSGKGSILGQIGQRIASRSNLGAAAKAMGQSIRDGDSIKQIAKSGKEAYINNMKKTPAGEVAGAWRKNHAQNKTTTASGGSQSGSPKPQPGSKANANESKADAAKNSGTAKANENKPGMPNKPEKQSTAGDKGKTDTSKANDAEAAKQAGEDKAQESANMPKENAADSKATNAGEEGDKSNASADANDAKAKGENEANAEGSAQSENQPASNANVDAEEAKANGEEAASTDSHSLIPSPANDLVDANAATVEGEAQANAENDQSSSTPQRASYMDAIKRGLSYQTGYREPIYSREDYRNAEEDHTANAVAARNAAERSQMGNSAMPDALTTECTKARAGDFAKLGNPDANRANYGIADQNGHVFQYSQSGNPVMSNQAIAAGLSMSDGDNGRFLTGSANSRSAAIAHAVSTLNADGSMNYGSIGSREEFVSRATRADTTAFKGIRDSLDSPQLRSAERAASTAQSQLETLRNSGASAAVLERAQASYNQAQENLHQATLAACDERIARADQAREALARSGVDTSSHEYQMADKECSSSRNAKTLYENRYNDYASNVEAANAQYDSTVNDARKVIANTIADASAYESIGALYNRHYVPQDCAETRQLAYNSFKDALPAEVRPEDIRSVSVVDNKPSTNNAGQYVNDGGRSVTVAFSNPDGSMGSLTFHDDVATSAMSNKEKRSLGTFQSADGSQFGVTGQGVSGKHVAAGSSGPQVKISREVVRTFARIQKMFDR